MIRRFAFVAIAFGIPFLTLPNVWAEEPVIASINHSAYLSNSAQSVKRSAKEGEVLKPGDYLQVPRGHYVVIRSGKDEIRVGGGTMIGRVENKLLRLEMHSGGEVYGMLEGDTPGGVEISTPNASAKMKDAYFKLQNDGQLTQTVVYKGGVSLSASDGTGVTGSIFLRTAQSSFVKEPEKQPRESFLVTRNEFDQFNQLMKDLGKPVTLDYQTSLNTLFRGLSEKERTRLLKNSPGVARELNSGSLRLIGSDVNVNALEEQVAEETDQISRWGEVLF